MRIRAIGCLLWVTACTAAVAHSPSAPALPPAAAHLAGHLSPLEQQHLAVIRGIHEGRGIARINRTVCVNPGSNYSEGVLNGSLIRLAGKAVRDVQLTSG